MSRPKVLSGELSRSGSLLEAAKFIPSAASGRADHQQRLDLGPLAEAPLMAFNATRPTISGTTKSIVLDRHAYDIACGQIDIGNALTEITRKQSEWVRLRLRGPIKSTFASRLGLHQIGERNPATPAVAGQRSAAGFSPQVLWLLCCEDQDRF